MVAGTSKAVGRVARKQKETRKASAFLERWLQAGGARKVLSQIKAEPVIRATDGWTQEERKEHRLERKVVVEKPSPGGKNRRKRWRRRRRSTGVQ